MCEGRGPPRPASHYERMQADGTISLRRRGNATSRSYGVMAAAAGAYEGLFADGGPVPPPGRLGLVADALIVLAKPSFMSVTAYGFCRRFRRLCKRIERHRMHGTPAPRTITSEIGLYGHGRSLPPATRGVLGAAEPPRALQRAHLLLQACRSACRGPPIGQHPRAASPRAAAPPPPPVTSRRYRRRGSRMRASGPRPGRVRRACRIAGAGGSRPAARHTRRLAAGSARRGPPC